MKTTLGSKVYDSIIYGILSLCSILALIPFIYVISGSLVSEHELQTKAIVLFPTEIQWDAYRYIFSSATIPRSLLISIFITLVGTLLNLLFTALMAYPLAKKSLPGREIFNLMVIFTMLFSGGLIPHYLVIKWLGLLNSYWALWLPGMISAFNLILLRNFFQSLPAELEESAKIDGYNDMQILWRIAIPLSKASMATFALFYAVGHWNSYFSSILYLNKTDMWPVQVWLRQITILAQGGFSDTSAMDATIIIPPDSIKLAVIVVATAPVLLVYPFLQKYFTKGLLLGSVKG